MNDSGKIEVGDTVWIGDGKVHWVVLGVGQVTARLKSGMTGRQRRELLSNLRLHSKGTGHGNNNR